MANTTKINRLEIAFIKNVRHCVNWEIGGMENSKMDGADPKEYALLENHEDLVKYIYNCAVNYCYGEGWMGIHPDKEWRFIGKEKMMGICELMVSAEGY